MMSMTQSCAEYLTASTLRTVFRRPAIRNRTCSRRLRSALPDYGFQSGRGLTCAPNHIHVAQSLWLCRLTLTVSVLRAVGLGREAARQADEQASSASRAAREFEKWAQ